MGAERIVPSREAYVHRTNAAVTASIASRTASREAGFFLPHLRSGMQLLDCGCGPGSITVGLAEAVAPARVIGIDLNPGQLAAARDLAASRKMTRVRFVLADLYALPFPDASFDATFAHAVLQHLREPARALAEIRRVLRPGGMAGVCDGDWGCCLVVPATPLLEHMQALEIRTRHFHGGNVYYARNLRRLLLEAGFARTEAAATCGSTGTLTETRRDAAFGVARFRGSFAETVLSQGWADSAELEAMYSELLAWGERPDAFSAGLACAVVGWVADAEQMPSAPTDSAANPA